MGCEHVSMRFAQPLASPSPRLPLGRLRPFSTGYGEGRDEGAFHRFGQAESPLSPQAGRGRSAVA
jgi:hypothetical protein